MSQYKNLNEAYKQAPMAQFVRRLQLLGQLSYLALLLYYPLFYVFIMDGDTNYLALLLFWLPLFSAVPGILRWDPYTYAWSNFLLMWCYMHGLASLWTYQGHVGWIWLEVVILTGAFIGNTYFARYRGRELGMALPKIKDVKEQEKRRFEGDNQPD